MDDIVALIGELAKLPTTWREGGVAVGVLGIVYVLIRATKLAFISKLLDKWFTSAKWARPTLAVTIGFLVGALTALSNKSPWVQVFFSGVMGAVSGFGANGFDQWLTSVSPAKREAALTSAAVSEAIAREDLKIEAATDAGEVSKELVAATTIGDGKARRSALAAWGRKYLPKPGVSP